LDLRDDKDELLESWVAGKLWLVDGLPYSVEVMTEIRIGSRGSQLALWQANHIADILRAQGHTVAIEVIRTTGDRMQQPGFAMPAGMDGKGIFIKEIEEALAAGRIDLAVHSLKDLPTELDERFCLAAIPPRADARDAWVCEPYWALHTLPYGGKVGTTSPRRRAQILSLRPDVQFVELRGNVDTRLRKLEEGACDALVLACAGLDRLGRTESVHQRFGLDELTPAPGQGALALETRSPKHSLETDLEGRDAAIYAAIASLDCAFLSAMGGGCELPLGAHCARIEEDWLFHAQVLSPDGEQSVEVALAWQAGEDAGEFGRRVAGILIGRGALELLAEPAEAIS
jgi:hydroxymethylbilane synthase